MSQPSRKTATENDSRRNLVAAYAVLEEAGVRELIPEFSQPIVTQAVREVLASYRCRLEPGSASPAMVEVVAAVREAVFESESERLRPVVNGTGIVLHTGMGRAVLAPRAVRALSGLDRCCNMQVDMRSGQRGSRNSTTERLLTRLTGAEAALVVNNNAAATLLVLQVLCKGREVLVSQGQVLEIGGSFRLHDCIEQAGAILVRVGTTNRTHLRDYERALSDDTGAILRVNPSNYRVMGFTKEVSVAELASLKSEHDLLLIDDMGCGALFETERFGLPKEYTVQESIAAGADLVCFSGDKLIGAAQSGIIAGRRDLIARIKKHPLTRMLRVCKLTDLVLEQTLRLFLDPETLPAENPTLGMLAKTPEELEARAVALKSAVETAGTALTLRVVADESAVGGGSMPVTPLKTFTLAVRSDSIPLERLLALLRQNEPPIIARLGGGDVRIDMRTLLEGDDAAVCQALTNITGGESRRAPEVLP